MKTSLPTRDSVQWDGVTLNTRPQENEAQYCNCRCKIAVQCRKEANSAWESRKASQTTWHLNWILKINWSSTGERSVPRGMRTHVNGRKVCHGGLWHEMGRAGTSSRKSQPLPSFPISFGPLYPSSLCPSHRSLYVAYPKGQAHSYTRFLILQVSG